jgi:Macrocin-O-methyltransferase (TylF)/Methyltransferase domain
MFPFWHDVVAPVIEAAQARRVVEIGALRGDQTELMLQRLGPDVELHVIDPVPFFDPAEHQRRFAGRYVFHRALSVDVLGGLPPMDVALIDGDHNWYTVFTELNLLADVAHRACAPMPVMVLHDVGWPYGRRDVYYDPSNIPTEHRQPWRRAGIRPGEERLVGGGGLNSSLANAELEGGARNGVMTAVDDFVAARGEALRLVVLPVLFGLAIAVGEDRLATQPALAAQLDRLESAGGKDMLLRLGEDFRVDSLVLDHALLEQTTERAEALASRYLETVKRSLGREMSVGTPAGDDRRSRHGDGDSAIPTGLDHLHACLDTVWAAWVRGDIAVTGTGVGIGASATFAAAYLEAHDHGARHQVLIAAPAPTSDGVAALGHAQEVLDQFDLLGERVRFLPGDAQSVPTDVGASRLAAIHLGAGAAVDGALDLLYRRLVPGGIVVVDDVLDPPTCRAVEAYRAGHGIDTPFQRSDAGHAHWRVPARLTSDP